MNFENLLLIEEKLTALTDNLKHSKLGPVSQLCSDWWELTDEDEYSLARFEKVLLSKDQLMAKKELRMMMVLEILAIAVGNYFTSTPELIRPN